MDFQAAFDLIWKADSNLLIGCVIVSALFFSLANRQALIRKVMHTIGFIGLGIVLELGRSMLFDTIGATYSALPITYTLVFLLSLSAGDWLSYLVHIIHIKFAGGRLWLRLARSLGKLALRFEAYGVHYMAPPERALYLKERQQRKVVAEPDKEETPPPESELKARTKSIIINDHTGQKREEINEETHPVNVTFEYTTIKPNSV